MISLAGRSLRACAALTIVAVLCGALSGCSNPSRPGALAPLGLGGSFSAPAFKSGGRFWLSFPMLENTAADTVHIRRFRVSGRTRNVQVLGYVVHTPAQFGAYLTGWNPSAPDPRSFATTPSLPLQYAIAPHTRSYRYAMAEIRVTHIPPTAYVRTCEVQYTQGASPALLTQQFDCPYQFGPTPPDPGPPGSVDVMIGNSSGHVALVFGCPLCKRGGAGIPSIPGADGVLGWQAGPNDTLTYPITVSGHHVTCRPPPRLNLPLPRTEPVTNLRYDVTRHLRCIVLPSSSQ